MNRETKFRAWDKINEEMIDFQKEWTVLEFDSGEVSNIVFKESEYYLGKDEFILMQYVGLKDKNGVEIYEGDILDYESYNKYEVYFMNGKFMACNELGYDINNYYYNKVKVIGNIYENKELLKK